MMKNKPWPINVILIVLGVLILGALAIWNVSCSQAPTHLIATPTSTGEQLALAEFQRHHGCPPGDQSCLATPNANESFYVYGTVRQVSRPEWETLFPGTKFYLVPSHLVTLGTSQMRNELVAFHQGQWYGVDSFQQLLNAYGIKVTDENRELVAKAFVPMTLANYLEEEIVFSDWGQADRPARFDLRYNYTLTVWTKIQGLKIQWFFLFQDDFLLTARGGIIERSVGNYTNVPFETLPLPSGSLEYWRRQ